MYDFLWPHGLYHTRLPYPSLSPGVCPSSCPLNHWCRATISSSAALFSFWLQSFPAPEAFPVSRLFASGGQSIGASASAKLLPVSIQGWFPLGLTGWISLQLRKLSRVFSSTIVQKYQFFGCSAFIMVELSHPHVTTRKNIALTVWTFFGKVLSLLFHTLSRLVIAFLPRSKCLNFMLQSPSTVILQPKKRKPVTASTFSSSIWSDGTLKWRDQMLWP